MDCTKLVKRRATICAICNELPNKRHRVHFCNYNQRNMRSIVRFTRLVKGG